MREVRFWPKAVSAHGDASCHARYELRALRPLAGRSAQLSGAMGELNDARRRPAGTALVAGQSRDTRPTRTRTPRHVLQMPICGLGLLHGLVVVAHFDEHRAATRLASLHLPWRGFDLARSATGEAIHAIAHGSAWARGDRGQLYFGRRVSRCRPRLTAGPGALVTLQRTGRLHATAFGTAAAWLDPSTPGAAGGGGGHEQTCTRSCVPEIMTRRAR